jgi:hypothetical protein
MGLAELKADAKLLREQNPAHADIYAMFEGMIEAAEETDAVVEDLSDAVDELIDQNGDVLHPETAAKVIGLVELGKLLAKELDAALVKFKFDDLSKKRIRQMVKAYRAGAEIVGEIIAEVTLPIEPEPEEVLDGGEPPEEPAGDAPLEDDEDEAGAGGEV